MLFGTKLLESLGKWDPRVSLSQRLKGAEKTVGELPTRPLNSDHNSVLCEVENFKWDSLDLTLIVILAFGYSKWCKAELTHSAACCVCIMAIQGRGETTGQSRIWFCYTGLQLLTRDCVGSINVDLV